MKKYIFLLALSCLFPAAMRANALVVDNLSVDQAAGTVTMTVAWSNSWNINVEPNNWDAVWVFVKFRQCGVDPNTEWSHGLMSTTLADHTIPVALLATDRNGVSNILDAAPNNTGIMLKHSAIGTVASAGPYTITLRVTNLPAVGTSIDVKVFGIEMVYIPTGNYWVGDNTRQSNTTYRSFAPQQITAGTTNVTLPNLGGSYPARNYTLGSFPRGAQSFYCMKYEISQGHYAGFLNTIPSSWTTTLYPGTPAALGYRYTISNTGIAPNIYFATRENRSMNFMQWVHLTSYLDWAALRPMSEMEFEKICRGLGPLMADEYAWGTTAAYDGTNISTTIPAENGTESFTAPVPYANCVTAGGNYTGGDGGQGPIRNGIFALPTSSTREQSGATYYGVMEMSGNIGEYVVVLSSLTQNGGTRPYTGTLGNGLLNAGVHDVADWPAGPIPAGAGIDNYWVGWRGGDWANAADRMWVCNRMYCSSSLDASWNWGAAHAITNHYYHGGRGLR